MAELQGPLVCHLDPNPKVYLITLRVLAVVTLPINLFGLFCVITQTPKHMKDAQLILFVYQITNTWLDLWFNTLLEPVLLLPLPFGNNKGLIALFFQCPIDLGILLSLLVVLNTCCSFMQTFHFRLNYVLPKRSLIKFSSHVKFILTRIFYYVLFDGLLIAAYFVWNGDIQQQLQNIIQKYTCGWELSTDPSLVMLDYKKCLKMFLVFMIETILIIISSLLMLAVSFYYLRDLPIISEKTRKLQYEFQLSLFIQVILPLALLLIPGVCYNILILWGWVGLQTVTNIIIASAGCHGCLGTIIMLLFNSHYRQYLLHILTFKTKVLPQDSSAS